MAASQNCNVRLAAQRAEDSLGVIARHEEYTRAELALAARGRHRSANVTRVDSKVIKLGLNFDEGFQLLDQLAVEDPASARPVRHFVTLKFVSAPARQQFKDLATPHVFGVADSNQLGDGRSTGINLNKTASVAEIEAPLSLLYPPEHQLTPASFANPFTTATSLHPADHWPAIPYPPPNFVWHEPETIMSQHDLYAPKPSRPNKRKALDSILKDEVEYNLEQGTPEQQAVFDGQIAMEQSSLQPALTEEELQMLYAPPEQCPAFQFLLRVNQELGTTTTSASSNTSHTSSQSSENHHTLIFPECGTVSEYIDRYTNTMKPAPDIDKNEPNLPERVSYRIGPNQCDRVFKYDEPRNEWMGVRHHILQTDFSDPRFWAAETQAEQDAVWAALRPTIDDYERITNQKFERSQTHQLPYGYDMAYSHIQFKFSQWCFGTLGHGHAWIQNGKVTYKLFKLDRWYGLIGDFMFSPNWPYHLRDANGIIIQNPDCFACEGCIQLNIFCHGHREDYRNRCKPCLDNKRECSKRSVSLKDLVNVA